MKGFSLTVVRMIVILIHKYAKMFTIGLKAEDFMANNNQSTSKLTKTKFLTVYPEFLHRFSHMSLDQQDYIIADPTLIKLYSDREEKGELDQDFNRQNDEAVEDQVNELIEKFNN